MARFRKFGHHRAKYSTGPKFEHWYRDNSIYFLTARCRDKFAAFDWEEAKAIFWDRFDYWTNEFGFVPCATTLMNNRYHTLGYLSRGENLGVMMQRIHGSVAKLVNDLHPPRHLPFWREAGRRDYFDGCIRDEMQCRRAYRYLLRQSVRARICKDWHDYPHTP